MSVLEPVESFLLKWRQRWPEWAIAEVFIDQPHRLQAVAWFALLEEWMQAAIGGEEAAPGMAKLAWWREELQGWAKGARRHPLGEVLQARPVDWNALADTMHVLREREALRGPEAAAHLRVFAGHVAEAEARLLGSAPAVDDVVSGLLHGHVPQEARNATAPARQGSRPRRLLHAMHAARARKTSRPAMLWVFWREARRGSHHGKHTHERWG